MCSRSLFTSELPGPQPLGKKPSPATHPRPAPALGQTNLTRTPAVAAQGEDGGDDTIRAEAAGR